MKGKTLAICALLTLSLAGGFLWLQRAPAAPENLGSKALLAALQGRTGDITQIEVIRPGEPPLVLSKNGEHWQLALPEEAGSFYPVAPSTLGSLLRALVDAKTVEAKTARAEQHARLDLAEQGEGAATRIRLTLSDAAALELLVGKAGQGGGQLVRLAGDNQVWLIDRAISLPADSFLGWINRRISHIEEASIQSIELDFAQKKDGFKTLSIGRDKEGEAFSVKQTKEDMLGPAVQDAIARLSRLFSALDLSEVSRELPADSQALLDFRLGGFKQERLSGRLFQQKAEKEGQSGAYWLSLKSESAVPESWLPAGANWVWRIEDFAAQTLFEALPKALADKEAQASASGAGGN